MKNRNPQHKYKTADFYARKAKKEDFAARSVYKLKEIHQKYRLIHKGDKVLDLGCAPGSWLKFAAQEVGDKGRVLGIDLKEVRITLPAHVRVICGDVFDLADHKENINQVIGNGYQVVLSDMAPSTTGHKETDSARSYQLCRTALGIAVETLTEGGSFVCKIFQGGDFEEFVRSVRLEFDNIKIFKPQSCRKESKEIYIIGTGKKGRNADVRT
jgi:23S rRNA (uridine2552-2'-O)-methyltransferase